MALLVPTDGQLFLAELLRRGLPFAPACWLFTDDRIPALDDVLADYHGAVGPGLGPQIVPAWDQAVLDMNGEAILEAPSLSWSLTSPFTEDIHGYWLQQNDWNLVPRLVAVERLPGVVPFRIPGPTLVLFLGFTVGSFFGGFGA